MFCAVLISAASMAQTAKIQVIHNSADAAASTVDVYLNGGLAIDDFAFRTATPFIDVPAGVQIDVAIAPSTSTSVSDAIATFSYTLTQDEKYVIVANGIVSGTGYSPAIPFDLHVFAGGRESATTSTNTDLLVCHGSTDAPAVSVWETGVGAGQLFNNFVYSDFEGYLELPTNNYVIEVRDDAGTTTLACYETATFNSSTCVWDVTGTQPSAPTGLACYETSNFNTTYDGSEVRLKFYIEKALPIGRAFFVSGH